MTTKERIFAVWNGLSPDHVPLTTWCFGLPVPPHLRWKNHEEDISFWYSKRMEHIHTLPQTWDLEDDFKRALAWQSLGIDDILDVSVPWSVNPEVTWKDATIPPTANEPYPVLVREYATPAGLLRHSVRYTQEKQGQGWVIQPDYAPLIEDFNIPRAVEHVVSSPADIPKLRYLFCPPDDRAKAWFAERMRQVQDFAEKYHIPVQAWSAFDMDAAVWFTGTEKAILMAMDDPKAFGELMEVIAETDLGRTELAASTPGVDLVIERGWYSSTDFWSPKLFDRFVYPHIVTLAETAHKYGKKFGYVMTTGVERLGTRLADAGVDVLYFVDPVQDTISLEKARDLLSQRMTLVGGTNALSLASRDRQRIEHEIKHAIDVLGPTNRFILHPVDAVFPDTPWEGIEQMIEIWQTYR
ncbi:uroporphyrinogen-III decarboxylase-like protein [Candidatus Vecturithrix granuli]|uniref:Uroporphyrinogen-III decarboxylase-like protein n=1 Tax=Vecturithrix granuli TaxID=1499967 RepID=A0A081C5I0_VECG1|nr:uroporphyrinogen-III decarboxylase-like protein [Candidatus Vecturithrix granuli]